MDSTEPREPTSDPTFDSAGAPAPEGPPQSPAPASIPPWLGLRAVVAALVAGFVAWALGENGWSIVEPRQVPVTTMGLTHLGPTQQTFEEAALISSERVYGIFGAVLAAALGIAGAWSRRSVVKLVTSVLVGVIVGGAVGFAVSYAAVPLYFRYRFHVESDLVASMMLHGAIWGAVGAAAGLVFAFGAGFGPWGMARCLIAGALGALVGAGAFELLGAMFFTNDETGEPISATASSRLFARMIVAAFLAFSLLAGFGQRRPRRVRDATAGPV